MCVAEGAAVEYTLANEGTTLAVSDEQGHRITGHRTSWCTLMTTGDEQGHRISGDSSSCTLMTIGDEQGHRITGDRPSCTLMTTDSISSLRMFVDSSDYAEHLPRGATTQSTYPAVPCHSSHFSVALGHFSKSSGDLLHKPSCRPLRL